MITYRALYGLLHTHTEMARFLQMSPTENWFFSPYASLCLSTHTQATNNRTGPETTSVERQNVYTKLYTIGIAPAGHSMMVKVMMTSIIKPNVPSRAFRSCAICQMIIRNDAHTYAYALVPKRNPCSCCCCGAFHVLKRSIHSRFVVYIPICEHLIHHRWCLWRQRAFCRLNNELTSSKHSFG